MSDYKPLALELRPKTFNQVVHNEPAVFVVQSMLKNDKLPNGFLLSGIRGVGKTTIARLVAKTLNCEQYPAAEPCNVCESCVAANELAHPDIIETSGSTNGKIEDVRNIIDEVHLSPLVGRKKVFIIDEAQGLGVSQSSWDALLKVLEEPPNHVFWIFCTTRKDKIPMTIKSRLVSLDLKAVPNAIITDYLYTVTNQERSALEVIARASENSIRDALTILEKLTPYLDERGWTSSNVADALGTLDNSVMFEVLAAIRDKAPAMLWNILEDQLDNGITPETLFEGALIRPVYLLRTIMLGGVVAETDALMPFISSIGEARLNYLSNVLIGKSMILSDTSSKKLLLQALSMELCM